MLNNKKCRHYVEGTDKGCQRSFEEQEFRILLYHAFCHQLECNVYGHFGGILKNVFDCI